MAVLNISPVLSAHAASLAAQGGLPTVVASCFIVRWILTGLLCVLGIAETLSLSWCAREFFHPTHRRGTGCFAMIKGQQLFTTVSLR